MASSEHIIGFSTGALAKGDFRLGLSYLKDANVQAVELSALRENELPSLSGALHSLDLSHFRYVSIHAPSRLETLSEAEAVRLLRPAKDLRIPVVVHPDIIKTIEVWTELGNLLLVENLDKRRPHARTCSELSTVFARLPDSRLCFDVAHARQVDPTMVEALQMLRQFGPRLVQLHASSLTTSSTHKQLSSAASLSISRIADSIPGDTPIILESPVGPEAITNEIEFARAAFSPWLNKLRGEIDDVFHFPVPTVRRDQLVSFLRLLQLTGIKLREYDRVIKHLPSGGPYNRADLMLSTTDLIAKLSDQEKRQLEEYLAVLVSQLAGEYPDLADEFREQFTGITPRTLTEAD